MPLSPKQNEYIRKATHRWNLKIGAVRSGKSYVDTDTIIPLRIRERAGLSGLNLIMGVSRETIERNVLQPMREIYTDRLVSTINGRNIAMVCGEPVYCLGAEKMTQVAKIQGSSIKYAYGDEVAKWNREVFYMLQSRLDKDYSCFDGSLNPESPTHWLKEFIDREDLDAYIQKYTIFDNPYLPKKFVDNLCKEYQGTVHYKRYILGEWALAEGLIYPMYEEALEEPLPYSDIQNIREWALSIDYGTQNAFAALLWGKRNGIWHCVKEYYHSGRDTGIQKTDEEYAKDMDEFVGNLTELETIIDPSAASFIVLLKKRNGKYRVRKADNSVADGIRQTASSIRREKVKISRSCENFIKELQGYAWDEESGEDVPIKVNDHACDAFRYFVKTKRISKDEIVYNSVF